MRNRMRHYTLDCVKTEGWYVGRLREMPEVISQGRTSASLQANIRDAWRLTMRETQGSVPRDGIRMKLHERADLD